MKEWTPRRKIADVFTRMAPFMQVYTEFITHVDTFKLRIEALRNDKNSALSKIMKVSLRDCPVQFHVDIQAEIAVQETQDPHPYMLFDSLMITPYALLYRVVIFINQICQDSTCPALRATTSRFAQVHSIGS